METETCQKTQFHVPGYHSTLQFDVSTLLFISFMSSWGMPVISVKTQYILELVMQSGMFYASLSALDQPIRRLWDTLERSHEKTPRIQTRIVMMCVHVPVRTVGVVICVLELLGYGSRVRNIIPLFLCIGYRSSRARGDISHLSSEEVKTSLSLRGSWPGWYPLRQHTWESGKWTHSDLNPISIIPSEYGVAEHLARGRAFEEPRGK